MQTDSVRFLLPTSREYQFPAMAVVQAFVNGFQRKMVSNWLSHSPPPEFKLRYELGGLSVADWQFWQKQNIKLAIQPEVLATADAEIDLTESRATTLVATSARKHLFQLYGGMCGIAAQEFPDIRKVAFFKDGPWCLTGCIFGMSRLANPISNEQLEHITDGTIFGVIGYAGWQTYLAAAYMLPVIEIVNPMVKRDLFSKWKNPYYRVVTCVDQIYSVQKALKEKLGATL